MKSELSILIPVYNDVCGSLVAELQRQAEAIDGLLYEIIVADDGSTYKDCIEANQKAFGSLAHCKYIIRKENVGRAAIRNFLAKESHYQWLLFIDCDMTICLDNYLSRYLNGTDSPVTCGGYRVGNGSNQNLRYIYEKDAEPKHTAEQRQRTPYHHFHTSNFLVQRDVMLANPFDERFRQYGYEDVLLGKKLRTAGVAVQHIANPVGFDVFEPNDHYVEKTEEGLHTLYHFRHDLRGYNSLLTLVNGIHIGLVKSAIRLWHRLFGALERRMLCGNKPNLTVFKLYKLGYYLTLTKID